TVRPQPLEPPATRPPPRYPRPRGPPPAVRAASAPAEGPPSRASPSCQRRSLFAAVCAPLLHRSRRQRPGPDLYPLHSCAKRRRREPAVGGACRRPRRGPRLLADRGRERGLLETAIPPAPRRRAAGEYGLTSARNPLGNLL